MERREGDFKNMFVGVEMGMGIWSLQSRWVNAVVPVEFVRFRDGGWPGLLVIRRSR